MRVARDRHRREFKSLVERNRLMELAESMIRVAHWRIDLGNGTVSWSDEIYRIVGAPTTYVPRLDETIALYHPDDRAQIRQSIENAMRGESFALEARIAHADGSYRDVLCGGQAERGAHDEVTAVFGVFQDITERKAAQREHERLADRIRLANAAARVGIWEYDVVAESLTWDPIMYALYGFESSAFPATYERWASALHGDDRARVERQLSAAIDGEATYDTEFRVVWPDGEIRHIRAMATVVRDRAGAADRVIGTNWDVTELRSLAEQLVHESRTKSEFLARMSHEIRTPMNGILGFASLMLETPLTPEQRTHMHCLRDAGMSLMVILNDMLDFSKIEAGRLQLERVPFRPAAVVEGALSIVRAEAVEKHIALDCHIDGDVPAWVLGDPTRLRQILLNLIGNALKFTSRGRVSVAVRYDPPSQSTRFEVMDTGIGIPLDEQHRLFDVFVQLSTSTSRLYGGTGLGLAICKRLVQAMDGTIGVSSMPGHGSTFWFSVSLPEAPSPPAAQTASALSGGCRILVVDDNNVNQTVVGALLKKDGHEVVLASDGAQALRIVGSQRFDLVLMDMQMPIMNGEAATRAIRSIERDPPRNIPIIALTANSMPDDVRRCREAGMNDHLTKPIDRDVLRATIEAWTAAARETTRPVAADPSSASAARASAEMLDASAALLDRGGLLHTFDGDRATVDYVLKTAIELIRTDVQRLASALRERDAQAIVDAAHRIKGTSVELRANRLHDLSARLERTADDDFWDVAPQLLVDLNSAVKALCREIETSAA